MTTQNTPIDKLRVIDRFATYVANPANSGISWGTNALPFGEFPIAALGGTTAGRTIAISPANLTVPAVTASEVYNVLQAEAVEYTRIRLLTARRYVTGHGYTHNSTAVAHMSSGYRVGMAVANSGVAKDNVITAASIQAYITNLQSAYYATRNTPVVIDVTVCHSSCHASCHNSRGRR